MSEFSNRFRQLKDESNLTLKDLSEALDITSPNLSYYMKGREPSYDILIKIADYFNVTTDWLIGRTDEKNTTQSSIISEIEKQLEIKDEHKLSGDIKTAFLQNQHTLYNAMVDMYQFFLYTSTYSSSVKIQNVYMNMLCSIFEYHIKELNKGSNISSKETILNLMKKEELIADTAQAVMLLSSYTCADSFTVESALSKEDKTALQEIITYTIGKYKDKNPDLFEVFSKMSQIKDD